MTRPERTSSRSELAYRRGSSEASVPPSDDRRASPASPPYRGPPATMRYAAPSDDEVDLFDEPPEPEPAASEPAESPPVSDDDGQQSVVAWAIGDDPEPPSQPARVAARVPLPPPLPAPTPPAQVSRSQRTPPTQPSLPRTPQSRSGPGGIRPEHPQRINSYFGPASQPQLAVTDVRAHTERIANPHATEFLLELRFKLRINDPSRD